MRGSCYPHSIPGRRSGNPNVSPGIPGRRSGNPNVSPGAWGRRSGNPNVLPGIPGRRSGNPNVSPGVRGRRSGNPNLSPGVRGRRSGNPNLSPGVRGRRSGNPNLSPGVRGRRSGNPNVSPGVRGRRSGNPNVSPGVRGRRSGNRNVSPGVRGRRSGNRNVSPGVRGRRSGNPNVSPGVRGRRSGNPNVFLSVSRYFESVSRHSRASLGASSAHQLPAVCCRPSRGLSAVHAKHSAEGAHRKGRRAEGDAVKHLPSFRPSCSFSRGEQRAVEARRPPLSGHNRYTDVPSSRPVSLRSKLQRLDGSRLQPAPASPAPAASAAPPSLEDLRRRIAAVLSRGAAPSPSPPAPRPEDAPSAELPFVAEETAHGTLHVRTLRLSAAHRTGHAPVLPARDASPALLSLLALDPSLAACSPRGALYLDTETTGLHGGTGTVAFLVGLAFWGAADGAGGGDLIVEQLLVKQLGEEAPVLARVAERLEAASMLVTFNGKSFDMPLLRTRFTMARMPWPGERPHLDLLHVARRLHKVRGIECRLTTIEREVLGFERVGDVPGSEVSARYLHYLRTGDAFPLLGVVEHNAWDVVAMAALVGLYGEPLDASMLAPEDLVGVARTLAKAGETAQAFEVASRVVEGGGRKTRTGDARSHALRARAEISKARGDRARAMADFETLAAAVDEPVPRPSGSSSPSCTSTTSRRRSRPSPWRSRGRASPPSSPASGTGGSRPESSARRGGSARCPAWTQARRAGRPGRDAEPGSVLDRGACPPTHPSPAALATTPRRSSPSGRRSGTRTRRSAPSATPAAPKKYILDMFPYPSGIGAPRRAPRGVHGDRHRRPLLADARVRRAPPDGLGRLRPAGRAARDPDRDAPARHDAEEHRDLQAPAEDRSASRTTGRARSTRPTRAT